MHKGGTVETEDRKQLRFDNIDEGVKWLKELMEPGAKCWVMIQAPLREAEPT